MRYVATLKRANLPLPPADEVTAAERSIQVLEALGLAEQDLTAQLEVAGEILREHRLWWQEEMPVIRAVNGAEHRGVLYQFMVGVSPAMAASLSDELVERIVDRDLDKIGLSVCFVSSQPNADQTS
jgi:hypothetical protein